MKLRHKTWLAVFFLFTLGAGLCQADMTALSEDEMGEFVGQEGICDIRLPETCNTDPELVRALDPSSGEIEQNANTMTTNPNLAILTGLMTTSDNFSSAAMSLINIDQSAVTATKNTDPFIMKPSIAQAIYDAEMANALDPISSMSYTK